MKTLLTGKLAVLFAAIAAAQPIDRVPDEYIVILAPNANLSAVVGAHNVELKRRFSRAGVAYGFHARIPNAQKLANLENDPRVDFVEPEVTLRAQAQIVPTGIARIGATNSALARINGTDERVDADIAVIDTGVQLDHPDLNVAGSVTFVPNTVSGADDNGHGTHVAGIAAALDNGIGVVGVAPGARLWAVKVLSAAGSGSLSQIIAGVDWVTDNAEMIEAANLSLGGQGYSDALRLSIQKAVARGVIVTVAAGNSGFEIYGGDDVLGTQDDFFPASYPEAMTISALADTDGKSGSLGGDSAFGKDDTLAAFSNYSKTVVTNNPVNSPGAAIDLAAPGVAILSTITNSDYGLKSGTSMAAPHAAGAAALYLSNRAKPANAGQAASVRQTLIDLAEAQAAWGTNQPNPNLYKDFHPEGLLAAGAIGGTNSAPAVYVLSPTNGNTFAHTDAIWFSGLATNAASQNVSTGLVWYSDVFGKIGSGQNVTNTLGAGTHLLSALVTDTNLTAGVSNITITVTGVTNPAPLVNISLPLDGTNAAFGASLTFSAVATNEFSTNVAPFLGWDSSLDGRLGTGTDFPRANLTVGAHQIRAFFTNSSGRVTADAVTAIIQDTNKLTLTAVLATDKTNYLTRDFAQFTVTASSGANKVSQAAVSVGVLYPSGRVTTLSGFTGGNGTFTPSRVRLNVKQTSVGTATASASVEKAGYSNATAAVTFTIGP